MKNSKLISKRENISKLKFEKKDFSDIRKHLEESLKDAQEGRIEIDTVQMIEKSLEDLKTGRIYNMTNVALSKDLSDEELEKYRVKNFKN